MNFLFLPDKENSELGTQTPDKQPLAVLRTSACFDGSPGEGYIIAMEDRTFLFSRSIGEDNYRKLEIPYPEISSLSIKKEKFESFIDMASGGTKYLIKFSGFEEKDIMPMLEKWSSVTQNTSPEKTPPKQPEPIPSVQEAPPLRTPTISPPVGLAAALMFLATADNKIAQCEDDYIRKTFCDNDEILKAGLEYYKSHSYDEVIAELSGLDHQQALCVLANMTELSMSDGTFSSRQQKMIWKFAQAVNLTHDEYQTVKDVLLLKNQLVVLYNK